MIMMPRLLFSGCLCILLTAGFVSGAPRDSRTVEADPSAELFTNTAVRHLRIEIGDQELKILRAPVTRNRNGSERPSVPATVREEGWVWTNVAVHLKGSLGSFRPVTDKPALTLKFDKLADKQRFHGLQKISLNNSVQDPSYVSERICRELYSAAGVPVPRVDYATVELNGRSLGLFVLAEGWNKQFLRRHFPNVKGNFYDLGGSHDVDKPMTAAFGENPTNHAALAVVAAAVSDTNHTRRLARLRETVDVGRFLSLHALDVLMWNWDGYGMGRNNYRMFQDLDAHRLVILPHGVDQMFWKANGPVMTGRSGLVARSLLETVEGRRLYLERFTQMRAQLVDARVLTNRVALLSARLKVALKEEGLFAVVMQQSAADEFCSRLVGRLRDVDAQLESLKRFMPIELNAAMSLADWKTRTDAGETAFTNSQGTLRVQLHGEQSLGAWTTTVWLEEGRYRIEGRVKTLGIEPSSRADDGAGFRVWSSRKETRGASWGWFPYGNSRDGRSGGLIPAFAETPQQRLTGDTGWTPVTHEFELRQPLADVEIQCALQGSAGAAWFDPASLKIQRVSRTVSKSTARGE